MYTPLLPPPTNPPIPCIPSLSSLHFSSHHPPPPLITPVPTVNLNPLPLLLPIFPLSPMPFYPLSNNQLPLPLLPVNVTSLSLSPSSLNHLTKFSCLFIILSPDFLSLSSTSSFKTSSLPFSC